MEHFEHKHKIGEGYFCDVALYKDKESGELVAVKTLKKKLYPDQDCHYRMEREIKLLERLQGCEYIMPLITHGEDADKQRLWYAMPYAKQNLHDFIRAHNDHISKELRYRIVEDIIEAIRYAHKRGILHRDISPTNVMVFGEGDAVQIRVCDFGLGKDKESLSHYTKSSASHYGQILYVSPEQRAKLNSANAQSDIYSLGKLIYFIFTGKDPQNFKPFELSTLVNKATEDIPSDRFADIDELYKHFKELKKLNLNPVIPDEYYTLKDVLKEYSGPFNWLKMHSLLVKGAVVDHQYSDYISPVLDIFSGVNDLKAYYAAAGNDIREFARTFAKRIDECVGTFGWPFKATEDFGRMLKRIITTIPDDETRLICLKQLWDLAFVSDQWAVQRTIKSVLTREYITPNIEAQLAEYIIECEANVDMAEFAMLDLPKKVKAAIIQGRDRSIKRKEEKVESLDNIF